MTNRIETATTAATRTLGRLAGSLAATLAGDLLPGQVHLTGLNGAASLRATSLDQDLDLLLLEIQRRRGRA